MNLFAWAGPVGPEIESLINPNPDMGQDGPAKSTKLQQSSCSPHHGSVHALGVINHENSFNLILQMLGFSFWSYSVLLFLCGSSWVAGDLFLFDI